MAEAEAPLGILVSNLGTPDAPTAPALRRYLAEFLWDPRVVEAPRPLWWLALNGVILRVRPRRSAAAYRRVWEADGSPLLSIALRQREALDATLADRLSSPVRVALGMRYGRPALGQALTELTEAGCEKILVLPLYPQYSGSTSGSTFDAVAAGLAGLRRVPSLRFVADYHDDDGYITALANSIRDHWAAHSAGERLLFSFHGIPRSYADAGDPYPQQCRRTAERVAAALGLPQERWQLVFQSRFGPKEWLQPYADKTLEALPGQGVKSVDIICPGFSADCLETLDEMAEENRHVFLRAGGERYSYIPALNDRADHMEALANLIERNMGGWL